MTKTMNCAALMAGLIVTAASAVSAQTLTPQPDTGAYISVALGGQPQRRSFGNSGTFTSFGETGRFEVNQNVGAGFMFDVAGGYRFARHFGAGVTVWSVRSDSAVSGAASVPDPVFFGRFTTVTPTAINDAKQTTLGINIQFMYTTPIGERFDLTVLLGPTVVKTKLDVGTLNVAANSTNVTLVTDSQSKTTAKAGNVGVDLTYRVNAMYSAGLFARFAGGEADLPALPRTKVGGIQVGGVLRYHF